MNELVSINSILEEKVKGAEEGKLLENLFRAAEKLCHVGEYIIEDSFTKVVEDYCYQVLKERGSSKRENICNAVLNVYYIIELYLRGYYNHEESISLEEFLNLVNSGKSLQIIEIASKAWEMHITRLSKILTKCKKRVLSYGYAYKGTKNLIFELERDLKICMHYPITSCLYSEFYFASSNSAYLPVQIKGGGFLSFEEAIYALHNELKILSRLDQNKIEMFVRAYKISVGTMIPFNLFEKVMNNYLFASVFLDEPEKLYISQTTAKLLINEIYKNNLTAEELVDEFLEKYSHRLSEYNIHYLREYQKNLQTRIDVFKEEKCFGELFFIAPPK